MGGAALVLATSGGCGASAWVNRLRTDYVAQSQANQARQELEKPNGNYQRAEALAQRALELDPRSLPVVRTAVGVFTATQAWDRSLQAVAIYEKLSGTPDLYDRGEALVYLGRTAEGQQALESFLAEARSAHALGLNGPADLAATLNDVGYVYADAGVDLTRALALTQEAARFAPGDPTIADSVAWAYYRLGRHDEAAFYQERALRLAAPEAELLYHAGAIHARQGRLILAEAELRRALALRGNFPEAQYELRRLRWQLSRPERV